MYGPDVQMCVGIARIGPAYQAFWAVHNRRTDGFRDRAALWPIVRFDEASARFDHVDVFTTGPVIGRGGLPAREVPDLDPKDPVRVTGTIDGVAIDSPGCSMNPPGITHG